MHRLNTAQLIERSSSDADDNNDGVSPRGYIGETPHLGDMRLSPHCFSEVLASEMYNAQRAGKELEWLETLIYYRDKLTAREWMRALSLYIHTLYRTDYYARYYAMWGMVARHRVVALASHTTLQSTMFEWPASPQPYLEQLRCLYTRA